MERGISVVNAVPISVVNALPICRPRVLRWSGRGRRRARRAPPHGRPRGPPVCRDTQVTARRRHVVRLRLASLSSLRLRCALATPGLTERAGASARSDAVRIVQSPDLKIVDIFPLLIAKRPHAVCTESAEAKRSSRPRGRRRPRPVRRSGAATHPEPEAEQEHAVRARAKTHGTPLHTTSILLKPHNSNAE